MKTSSFYLEMQSLHNRFVKNLNFLNVYQALCGGKLAKNAYSNYN